MPTYEYVCGKCDTHLEVYQSFDEEPLKRHRGGCGGKLTKVLAPVGVVLKGSGFYKTDSSDSARSKGAKQEAAASSDTSSSDKGSSTSKSESTSSSGETGASSSKTTSSKDGTAA